MGLSQRGRYAMSQGSHHFPTRAIAYLSKSGFLPLLSFYILVCLWPYVCVIAQTDDPQQDVRIAGPLATKAMVEKVVAAFEAEPVGKPTPQNLRLHFRRLETPSSAARALMADRADVILTWGEVSERELRQSRNRWRELAAEPKVVGVRAIAIVVHPRNAIDSLSLDQLEALYRGRAEQWSVVGGGHGKVRCYVLPQDDPLSILFHDKVLPASRLDRVIRKKDSQEILQSLASDPNAIAYVDAAHAMSAGDAVRILSIDAGDGPVALNAQTLEDGQYVLGERLVMYQSPVATEATQSLAQYMLDGFADSVYRKHGFIPTLREVQPKNQGVFESLYGQQIENVHQTQEVDDDIRLADELTQSARSIPFDESLIRKMCQASYDLAKTAAARPDHDLQTRAYVTAFEALLVQTERLPQTRFDAALLHAALYEQAWKASRSRHDGEVLVRSWMRAANLGTQTRQHGAAFDCWREAQTVAKAINSARLIEIEQRYPAFESRHESMLRAKSLASGQVNNTNDPGIRQELLMLHLVELDDPHAAVKYLDSAKTESIRTHLPLATTPLDQLTAEAALSLAEWYGQLMNQASSGGAELIAAKAKTYYTMFFDLHEDRKDALATRASIGIRRVGGEVPPPQKTDSKQSQHKHQAPEIIPVLADGQEMTDLKLAEFVAANPEIERVTTRDVGNLRHVTDLSALIRLNRLNTLKLQQLGQVKSVAPLAHLPNLNSLTLNGLTLNDASPLARLFRLKTLHLKNMKNLSDLTPIGKLSNLTHLDLSGCESVKDLSPLIKLKPTLLSLNISGCKGIENFAPLHELTQLQKLDLRQTKASQEDVDKLNRALIDTRLIAP